MKTYEQFQYERLDESIINRVAGAANRMRQGASKMIGGANKAMSRAGSTMGRVGRSVASSVPRAANQVKKTTSNVRKEFGQNSRAGRFKAANVLGNRNVRSGLSAVKKGLGNIRGKTYTGQGLTSAFTSGSGVGSEIKQGVKDRKKFERSKIVQYDKPGSKASGQKLPTSRTVVQRGRELDSQGNPIDRGKRGKSLINKATSKLRRNIGLSDVKDRTPTPPKPGESTPPTNNNRITGPGGVSIEKKPETPPNAKGEGKEIIKKFPDGKSGTVNVNRATGGGTEVDAKGNKKITKKYIPPKTKQGTKITGGGSRMQGDTTIEKGADGKMKVTQKVGDDQRIDTQDGIETVGRKTDRKNYPTTKTPFGKFDSAGKRIITGDKTSSPVVTKVDKKPSKSTGPGQAQRKKMTQAQETNPRREKKLLDKTPVQSRGGEGATDDPKTSPKVTYKTKDKVTTNMTPRKDESETKKQSLGDRVKANVEKGVNVDDGQGSYKPVINKAETSNDKKSGSGAGRPQGTKNTSTQLSLMRSLNKPSAPANSSERKKQQMQQQQSANDPRRPGSDDLSDGGNTERATTYKPPSKIESQNIQTKSVINQSRKKNQNATKKSKGGDAKSGGGNQEENKNPIKKKIVKINKKKNKEEESTTSESFSHWREEFLWEVDKKYPEKVKEIKPMSGKNTITINPEDESSKYKRGY